MAQKLFRRLGALLSIALLFTLLLPGASADGKGNEATILFTHDLHSRFFPRTVESGADAGGYARLATALAQERALAPGALTVDGGDFSMGSPVQTLYAAKAPDLITLGALGYDAVTVGNHEFDYGPVGFADMLHAAKDNGGTLPKLVLSNYAPSDGHSQRETALRAMSRYGVETTLLIERAGVAYGILGLMGEDADMGLDDSGFTREDTVKAAQRCVDELKEAGAQVIIALSHGGTDGESKRSEDEQLARQVAGIDLIVSGHSHTVLEKPIVVGSTYIVSAGANCAYLGSVTLSWTEGGEKSLSDYRLIPIDGTLEEDGAIAALIGQWKSQVTTGYLSGYGYQFDRVLARSTAVLAAPNGDSQQGNALGELIADAFLWAANETAEEPCSVAVVARGELYASLPRGEITVAQVFDVLPSGVGADGRAGEPLVAVYLSGNDLKTLTEIDATAPLVEPLAQLYLSGLRYSVNTNRVPFNRVTERELIGAEGISEKINGDGLYRVVGGLRAVEMLVQVDARSRGLLSIVPKDAAGNAITDLTEHILYNSNGDELKQWSALAGYLENLPMEGELPTLHSGGQPDGRKAVSDSLSPFELMKNPNWISLLTWAVLLLLCVGIVLAARSIYRKMRNRRYGAKKPRGSYSGRRGR